MFRLTFLFLALVSLVCLVMGARLKRRNIGFMITSALVAVCDIICFFLLGSKNITGAKNILIAFYIGYAWLCFGVIWTISAMGRYRYFKRCIFPAGLICIYQTVLMASNWFGSRILSFAKHIFLGRTWWIAESSKSHTVFFSFSAYRGLLFVNTLIIFALMVACCINSAKLFRVKFYALGIAQILVVVLQVATGWRKWPVWIICIVLNLICVFGHFYINYYSKGRLRSWSLMNFANEMSDGFVLYDEYDDPIHMNDLLKNTFSGELIEEFRDKSKLDEWILQTENVENMEVVHYINEDKEVYFKAKKTELKAHKANLGTIYILHDTTDSIRRIRAMEEANRELERAAKMKSDFLANMSHEIRTPMNAVIGMAELSLREDLPPQVRDYLGQIQHSGRNLLNIINDILDFSKIEAGKMEIIPDRYEPLSELNDIANVLATRIGDKDLELFVTADTNIPHALKGDAMRIRQIIINLANNAIKFSEHGFVRVEVSCEKTSEDEVMLTYHVIDTGSGIKEEDMKKLFVSFQQVDSKRNRAVEGTGLGLAISKSLCQAMGGSIGVTSEYGKGSDFYFSIPQKIMEPEFDLVVKDAEEKFVYCMDDSDRMTDMFTKEMDRLGIESRVIHSLGEYENTGKKEYMFFEENGYGDELHSFLASHKNCEGVILVGFSSECSAQLPNTRIMRRPMTTLGMVMTLNNKELTHVSADTTVAFKVDFIAPDAKILIVDDNAINITVAEGLLRPLQAKCFSAGGGQEAIDKVKEEHFDVILMDHMMPGLDGIETTRIIKKTIPSAADTPIIALTANAMEGAKEMFLREGMSDFVTKPVDIRDLVTKLRQWLPEEKILQGESAQNIIEQSATEQSSEENVSYDGLDSENAIKGLGSADLYRRVVQEYYRSGEAKYEGIRAAYEQEDWKDYTIKVHALKSSSRQIGADVLGEMAAELEKAGNALVVETIRAKNEAMLDTFKGLLGDLSKYFPEEETSDADLEEIAADELYRILDGLAEACDNLDMDEMESAKETLKKYSYPEDIRETMNELYEAIDNIDVDTCAELIEKIKG